MGSMIDSTLKLRQLHFEASDLWISFRLITNHPFPANACNLDDPRLFAFVARVKKKKK